MRHNAPTLCSTAQRQDLGAALGYSRGVGGRRLITPLQDAGLQRRPRAEMDHLKRFRGPWRSPEEHVLGYHSTPECAWNYACHHPE